MAKRQQICPCCKRPFPPTFDGIVTGGLRTRMVAIIAGRPDGISNAELCDALYATDPNGGPAWAQNCVSIMVMFANKQLAPYGYRIASRRGPGARYRLLVTT